MDQRSLSFESSRKCFLCLQIRSQQYEKSMMRYKVMRGFHFSLWYLQLWNYWFCLLSLTWLHSLPNYRSGWFLSLSSCSRRIHEKQLTWLIRHCVQFPKSFMSLDFCGRTSHFVFPFYKSCCQKQMPCYQTYSQISCTKYICFLFSNFQLSTANVTQWCIIACV